LISDSASARWSGAADSISIAAAARPKERAKQRPRPRPGSAILIMRETSLKMGDEKPRPRSGLPSARSFVIVPNIKLKMTT
jgi:hypothetical protein